MSSKMERFTSSAQQVLSLAQEAAERYHHRSIELDHLLLGMITEEDGVAGRVLRSLDIEPLQIMRVVKQRPGDESMSGDIPPDLSSDMKQTLRLAVDEARKSGQQSIDTQHLLLALLRHTGTAVELLSHFNVTPVDIRNQIHLVVSMGRPKTRMYPSASSLSSTPPELKHGPARLQNAKHFVMKILQMMGENKLTSEQAAELLEVPFPQFALSTGKKVRFTCQFKPGHQFEPNQARLIIVHEETKSVVLDQTLSLDNLLGSMSDGFIIQSQLRHQIITAEFGDEKTTVRLEFQIEEADA